MRRGITNLPDAEELAQAVFEYAWKNMERLPGPGEELPWLLSDSRRRLSNHWRSVHRRERLLGRVSNAVLVGFTSSATDANEVAERVAREALNRLPARQREAFRLVNWEDLTHAEAARVMGCSVNAFNLLLFRGKAKLTEEINRLARDDAR